jgi:hypothetical protein
MLFINIFGRFYPTASMKAVAGIDHRIALPQWPQNPFSRILIIATFQTKVHFATFEVFCGQLHQFADFALQGG